ncbi:MULTISPECIES: hypothetical protein [unclassified Lentimonas]|uniref:hypothetical protein n=1 Tax=unclassified Lentimonas TaxID=2630993 RepID=UPI001324ED18|nr:MULTISPECIES: hypothetical protein [unclassified Lentimonas]CAA6679778.1 Unannotated [Lentimonas sp. CC4]CAA6685711.1 Unannotated [Lentimonas sp. CC6]CAA7077154.1 Unannotated [Lentimonas sp. CC4]CAA7168762.1 Unannotated [Lentimonas sp. CC21]CAA7180870.1 Unannotated [Lentimonas sp. CC8]
MMNGTEVIGGIIGIFLLYAVFCAMVVIVGCAALYFLLIKPSITHWHREAAAYRPQSISGREEMIAIARAEIRDERVRRG